MSGELVVRPIAIYLMIAGLLICWVVPPILISKNLAKDPASFPKTLREWFLGVIVGTIVIASSLLALAGIISGQFIYYIFTAGISYIFGYAIGKLSK